jgi:hypothetical protein
MCLASHGPKEFGRFHSVARSLVRLTQGKPWAKLSCPFGAGPSGRMAGAKQHSMSEWFLSRRDAR